MRLLLAALLSLTVAKNAVVPQADPSTLKRVSMAKAGVIGVQMRAAHRPPAKTDEGWQNALDRCAGRRQAALGAVVRRNGMLRQVGRLGVFRILSLRRLLEDVFRQSTRNGLSS